MFQTNIGRKGRGAAKGGLQPYNPENKPKRLQP